jgi:hypothetical protein
VFRDITQRVKDQRSKLQEPSKVTVTMTREEKEMENCTFHPKINRRQENESMAANGHPKGYFEMINRMRRVNEEKRAIEEKKYVHQEVMRRGIDFLSQVELGKAPPLEYTVR